MSNSKPESANDSKRSGSLSPLELLGIAGAALCAVAVVVMTAQVLMVIFGGVLLAIVLFDCSRWLAEKTHAPRGAVLAGLVVLGLASIGISLYFSAALLGEQVAALGKALPNLLQRLHAGLEHVPIARNLNALLDSPKVSEQAEHLPSAALAAISGSLELFGAGALVFFVAIYGAAQPELHERVLLAVVPKRRHPAARAALQRVSSTLSRWMLGRLVAMAFVGITTGISFHLLKIPAAFALALFAGLLTFVEYAGAIISAIPPLLLSLAQGPSTAIAVLVIFTVLHVIEGYVLTPLLARVAVHFPPAFAIASQAIFGALLGPLGLTFSTPLLVAVTSAIQGYREASNPGVEAERND